MTVDISFGKIVRYENENFVEWEIADKNDGTSEKYTIFSGRPLRSFPTCGYYDFLHRNKQMQELHKICKPKYPNTTDPETKQINTEFIKLVENIPLPAGITEAIKCDIDRITWLKFWTKLCFETFGEDAYIRFS